MVGMILSVDLGTTKICAAAVDVGTGLPLAVQSRPNDSDVSGLADDMHEQDPVRIRDLCFQLMMEVLEDERASGQPVEAIGISGQMHGVLLVDRDLEPRTNLITWRDRRTARDNAPGGISETVDILGESAESRTGCRLATGYGGATLRWLDRNRLLPSDCTALSAAGYIAASLTGVSGIDETHAASWGILDLTRNCWDEQSVLRLGLRHDMLPEIIRSGRPLGGLRSEIAQSVGIVGHPVVCSPVGDVQASVVGAAGFAGDTVVVNIGTGAQISMHGSEAAGSDELDTWPLPFGGFLWVGAAFCGGWSYAYLKNFFQKAANEIGGVELSDEEVYERLNALAEAAAPESDGLLVDTRFSGTRRDKNVTGSITGIDTVNLTPANLSRAVLEGIVRDLHSMWISSGSSDAHRLVAGGNAVRKNPALRSIIRRVFRMDCFLSSVPEEAVRGAAYAAAVGAELVSSDTLSAGIRQIVRPF